MSFSNRINVDHFFALETIHEHADKSEIIQHQIISVKIHEQETIIGHFKGKLFHEMKNKWHKKFKIFCCEVHLKRYSRLVQFYTF